MPHDDEEGNGRLGRKGVSMSGVASSLRQEDDPVTAPLCVLAAEVGGGSARC